MTPCCRLVVALAIATTFVGAAGCSGGTPGPSLGEQVLRPIVESQSAGRVVLEDFNKTNGILREVAGQKLYTMEYSATVQFRQGGWKSGNAFEGRFSDFAARDQPLVGLESIGRDWKYFEKGAQVRVTGEIAFENTERGWRQVGFAVKASQVLSNRPDQEYYDRFVGRWAATSPIEREVDISKKGGQYVMAMSDIGGEPRKVEPVNQHLEFSDLNMPVHIYLEAEARAISIGDIRYAKVTGANPERSALSSERGREIAAPVQQAPSLRDERFVLRAEIDDPDGFTNVRSSKSSSSDVVAVIRRGEEFRTFDQTGDWWQVKTSGGVVGYVYATRIKIRR